MSRTVLASCRQYARDCLQYLGFPNDEAERMTARIDLPEAKRFIETCNLIDHACGGDQDISRFWCDNVNLALNACPRDLIRDPARLSEVTDYLRSRGIGGIQRSASDFTCRL